MPGRWLDGKVIIGVVALFAAYYVTARVGLTFDALSGVATTVWPPSGIALAALLRLGLRAWPGVFLAAFVVNAGTGIPLAAAAIIAVGNTLEAVIGAGALMRFGFRPRIDRLRDVFLLVGVAAIGSTLVSATFGLLAIWWTVGRPPAGPAFFWSTWWLGDFIGDLLVAPLLLTWSTDPRLPRRPRKLIEAACVMALLGVAALVSFGAILGGQVSDVLSGSYSLWPFLIWAALRLGQRGAVTAILAVAIVAIACTAMGHGPFVRETSHESLRVLQSYIGITAVTLMTLAAALAERRRAIIARDDFLSIASHELRTPLTALKLRLELAARELGPQSQPPSPAEVGRLGVAVSASVRHVARLERLIDDLLDASRLRADRLALSLEEVSLTELVRDSVARLGEELTRAGSRVELDLAEEVIATCDRTRIEQVITNLLTNAVKYAPGEPVHIALRAEKAADGGPGRARITVRDRGRGIAKAEQRRIFEPYRRLAPARHLGGLGLGLYIGREIAEAHGGSLTVESQPDAGSIFILDLPLEQPARAG